MREFSEMHSVAREIEQSHDDDDGDELGDDAVAHQPVRPFAREISADPQGGKPRDQDRENDENCEGDEKFSVHVPAVSGEAAPLRFDAGAL